MSKKFKRTKILATIGPSVFSSEMIEKLLKAGVNGCRMNFSHGSHEEKDEQIGWIRSASKKIGRSVAIVQDLQGPKIRLGEIKDDHLDVKQGDELVLDFTLKQHDGGKTLPVQYNLAEKVKPGEPLFIFDGKVRTEVIGVTSATAIKVKVMNDGFLMSKKGINLPDTDMGGDILTPKDLTDIEFGATRDFDYVAISFIQSADDVERVRQALLSYGSEAQIIAKIETKKAVETYETMEEIVKAADGIMVARGDMAYEVGLEVVPVVQRKLVSLCRKHGKLCIIATQMMASMVDSPVPTRSEVNDVATAVIQGADAVMLSDESTVGKYPIETVMAMRKVILYTQENCEVDACLEVEVENKSGIKYDALSEAAVDIAERIKADAIVCETKTGLTAWAISANRPNIPIYSVTSNARVAQQLALTYANSSYVRPYSDTYGYDLAKELKNNGNKFDVLEPTVVIVSGRHKNVVGGTDTIQVRKIK
ncbi:MAG: pyruvate kinase [Candidatus Nomurabacteria bacterium]|jgi:pyruvate kinase|nr:pyruvate kinase [Candidatus Nomurabacteria bacterium]